MSNTDIVKKMYQFFVEGQTEKIKTIFSDDLQWNMLPGFPNGGTYIGIDAVFLNVFGYFKEYWIDWKAISEEYIETQTGVFVIGYYEGTFKQTGKYAKAKFASFYKVKSGKISEYHQYTDTALILRATIK